MWKMLKHAVREFCSNTGLHGYNFLIIPKRILFERVIWIIILITSIITATVISGFAWIGTQERLVQTVADSTNYPIWHYPFPAVTVCNFNQISKSKTYEMVKHIKRPSDISTEDLARDLRLLIQLGSVYRSSIPQWNLIRLQNILDQNYIAAEYMYQKLTPNCTEMLQRCKWKGEEKRCEILFEQIKTVMGFCCSFNYYAMRNHRFSGAMPNKTPAKPRRLSACGYKTALEVLVDNNPNDYFATDIPSYGYRVLIHDPYEFPDWNVKTMWVEMKLSVFMSVSPITTKCNSRVAKLSVQDRNCLFATEKQLHNFQYYNHHNCMIECRMKVMVKHCGCVPFYYYNENGTFEGNRICTLRDTACLLKHGGLISSSIPGIASESQEEDNQLEKCGCLPDCAFCIYPFECSSGAFSRKYATNGLSLFNGVKIQNQSMFRVFFNDLVSTKNTKVLRNYWHTLFALFGGLLSLFTGFSFGTAFELVYFFILRPSIRTLQGICLKNKKVKRKNYVNDESAINKNAVRPTLGKSFVASIPLKTRTKFVQLEKDIDDFKKSARNNDLLFLD